MNSKRINNWISRPEQESMAETDILYNDVVTVLVYRTETDTPGVGFSKELPDEAYFKSLNVRIDEPRSGDADLVGLTEDIDVLEEDRWKWVRPDGAVVFLRVKGVNVGKRAVEVELKYG